MLGRTAQPTIARGGMGLTMPEPRTAEEMVEQFRGEELLLRYEGEQDELLSKWFRRYARQVGEAGRDEDADAAEKRGGGDWDYPADTAAAFRLFARTIRARSVECP